MKDNRKLSSLNAMRILGVEAINKANSGHPGIVLGAAPMMYTLFTRIMHINPQVSKWMNRDRFVMSAGHGSALLYSALHLSGYKLSLEDLKQFRQIDSLTPGHPEFGHTDGVDATSGPLGQGIAMAVGMAVAESHLRGRFNKEDLNIIDHFTFAICGDGDLQEGVAQEAISFAGRYKLNRLVILHDSNDIQLDAPVKVAQTEDMQAKFKAANWNTILITDGEDVDAIEMAINSAKSSDKPTYIEVKTIIGMGSTNQGTQKVHGAPLGSDISTVKEYYNWSDEEFSISSEIYDFYKDNVKKRCQSEFDKWEEIKKEYSKKYPELWKELNDGFEHKFNFDIDELMKLNKGVSQATRVSSSEVFNALSKLNKNIIGGSADLSESTKIKGQDGNYDFNNLSGRNIMYGVREFAMSSINNGIALHGGLLPVASGFFVFSDYMKPSIRLSALAKLQTLNIFTHDSLAVGEDGPTHQPVEQLAMLRSIPNISVYRPCDMQETIASYVSALQDTTRPSVIVATRQNLIELKHNDVLNDIKKGAYIICDDNNPKLTLIATGSEVSLALDVKKILKEKNISVRVVSMPNMNLFNKQSQDYQNQVIDRNTIRISLELGSTFGWERFTGDKGLNIGFDSFGYSAPAEHVITKIGFTASDIANKILNFIK